MPVGSVPLGVGDCVGVGLGVKVNDADGVGVEVGSVPDGKGVAEGLASMAPLNFLPQKV